MNESENLSTGLGRRDLVESAAAAGMAFTAGIDSTSLTADAAPAGYVSGNLPMKPTLRSAIIALLLINFAACCRLEAKAPNILFCMADDWGWPHARAYGDQVIKTPTFDRLAKEGILFERAFVSSPSCTPCRNAILTGQQFYRLEAGANLWSTLDVSYPNFMFLLRESGYEIGHWRKAWGPGSFEPGGYKQDPCGPASTLDEFMQQRDKGKPFCFWFGTYDPHRSYVTDSGAKSGIPVDKVQVPAFYPNTAEIRSDIADYYFEVERWDRDVGKAIKHLEAANELDNTIIVMTGDHGMPFPRCKANLYDWGTRVPLAIRWGRQVKSPGTVDKLVSLTDLAPTFLAVAGVEIPEEMTGHSLLPILKNQSQGRSNAQRDFVVFGRERHVPAQQKPSMQGYPARAIRTDRWLLKLNLKPDRWPAGAPAGATHLLRNFAECDDGPTKTVLMGMKDDPQNRKYYQLSFGKRPAVELYDCKQDPDQINNLVDEPEHAGTVAKLRAQLLDYLRNTEDPRFTGKPVKFESYRYYGRL